MAKYLIDENIENNNYDNFDETINNEFLNNIISYVKSNSLNINDTEIFKDFIKSDDDIEIINRCNQRLFNDFIKSNLTFTVDSGFL